MALTPILSANDDGEIVDASIVLTVSPDFKVKEEVSITKRLLSYQALDTDGDPRTPYCSDLQTLTITRARVTTPGGKVVDCTPNALNLSTPEALVAHPELSGWQEMVVTFLGLEPGAQTELSYIREDKSAFRTAFEKKQILAWHFPIRKGTVTVRLPKEMKLTYQIMNFQGEAAANAVADLMEYTFSFKDIPAFSDRDMHNGEAFLPTLYLTTTPSWEAAGKRLQEIAEKYGSPDEAITKKAKELTKDAMTDLDKGIAIHKYVKENFKEIEWPLQDSLLLFNGADKTFAAGQGTNLELALLLRAMLNAIGTNTSLAFERPLPAPDNAPGLIVFEQAKVYNSVGSGGLKEAPEPEPYGCFIVLEGSGWQMQIHPKSISWVGEIEFKKDGYVGSAILSLTGSLNPYWKNLMQTGALEDAAKAFLPFPGLKLEETTAKDLDSDFTRLEVKFTGKFKEEDRTFRLLPETKAFLEGVDPRMTSAALPVDLPLAKVSVRWTIKGIPGPTEPEFNADGKWGTISMERIQDGTALQVRANMEVINGSLPPADYPSLQAALAAWQNPVVAGVLLP